MKRRLSTFGALGALFVAAALLFTSGCLVDDRFCLSDPDCPAGQICQAGDQCVLAQCKTDLDCGNTGMTCVAPGRCQYAALAGGRVKAPNFCLEVVNPKAEHYGKVRCLEQEKGRVVLLFFALLG